MVASDNTTRLDKMLSVLQAVAAGDFSQQIEVATADDELASLEVGVNLMVDDLQVLGKENTKKTEALEMALKKEEKTRLALEEKLADLRRFQKVTVGRELRMVELKDEVEKLEKVLQAVKRKTGRSKT